MPTSAAFELAGAYRYLRPAMELAYLCRLRQGEVRALKKSDVTERGIDCKRLKGSRDAVTLWSPRLREAVRLACAIEREVDSIYLLHNANGQPLTKTGFDTAWQRLQARVRKDGVEPFHFHDLKAKGISDFAGDKQAAGGHARRRWWRSTTARSPGSIRRGERPTSAPDGFSGCASGCFQPSVV